MRSKNFACHDKQQYSKGSTICFIKHANYAE